LQEAYGTHGPTNSNLVSSPSVFPSISSEYNDGPLSASNHLDSIPTSIVNRTAGLKPKDLGTLLLGLGLEKYLSKFHFNPFSAHTNIENTTLEIKFITPHYVNAQR